jgi:hypothetical protein
MRGIGYDSMGSMVEYDIPSHSDELYLVVIDRGGDTIVRRMVLKHFEVKVLEMRIDIPYIIKMNQLDQLPMLSVADLGEEEGV